MAARATRCPSCQAFQVEVRRVINPDTTDMNARAELACVACGHEWEGAVTSPHHQRQRSLGRRR